MTIKKFSNGCQPVLLPDLCPLDFTTYSLGKLGNIINDPGILIWSSGFFDIILQLSGQDLFRFRAAIFRNHCSNLKARSKALSRLLGFAFPVPTRSYPVP